MKKWFLALLCMVAASVDGGLFSENDERQPDGVPDGDECSPDKQPDGNGGGDG